MKTIAVVPARDEEDCISACIQALDRQVGSKLTDILVFANNCRDRTVAIARSAKAAPQTKVHVLEKTLPPECANAGMARRLAMQFASSSIGPDGVILTTDADGQVEPDWLSNTLAAIEKGAEVVAGYAELNPIDWGTIPIRLHEDDAREGAYDEACDEIHSLLDPDPFDPWPRHTQHSGASIAVTGAAFLRCGGVPAIASGEDRALVAALRRVDARIRHAPEVRVFVSGRTIGRAEGGMADTIRRRLARPDETLDDRLEPAAACARRAMSRAALRRAYFDPVYNLDGLAVQLEVPLQLLVSALRTDYFGKAWQAVEATAPTLKRKPVAVSDLPQQMAAAQSILDKLRLGSPFAVERVLLDKTLAED